MENASKALIMAGGILIALLVIGALLLMFNQIGSYEKAQTTNVKTSQLAKFNEDFERYTDDNGIQGVDIISIINKVVDYNKKTGVSNSVNYDIKMTVSVKKLNKFKEKYKVSSGTESLFSGDQLIMGENSSAYKNQYFSEIIKTYSKYEKDYTLSVMNGLSSSYFDIKDKMKQENISDGSQGYYDLIKDITGKNISNIPRIEEIAQYKEYAEFKSATFRSYKSPDYENGQIKNLYFEFVK